MNVCRGTNCFEGANRLPKKWVSIAKTSPEAKRLKVPIEVFPLETDAEYCHFGLKTMIQHAEDNLWLEAFGPNPANHPPKDRPVYEIDVNIDGADIRRQGSKQQTCWPILIRVHSIKPNFSSRKTVLRRMMAPLTVGVYIGKKKPGNSTLYLEQFAHELKHLHPDVCDEEEPFAVVTRVIIADTPARAFIKNIECAQSYFMCEKCRQPGSKPSIHSHTSIWTIQNLLPRTDRDFYSYTKHVKHVSITYMTIIPVRMKPSPLNELSLSS